MGGTGAAAGGCSVEAGASVWAAAQGAIEEDSKKHAISETDRKAMENIILIYPGTAKPPCYQKRAGDVGRERRGA